MPLRWTTDTGEFVDVHDRLRPYREVLDVLRTVESEGRLKEYFDGQNAGGRWIFQVLSTEFVRQLASVIEDVLAASASSGPVLEVMSGDGFLAEGLQPLVEREVIATDTKSSMYRIAYPKWVSTCDAVEALERYRPSFVIVCWEPYLSMAGVEVVNRRIPLAWIGETPMCGHPDLFDIEHRRLNSPYAIGRHDSVLCGEFNTDVYLFNCGPHS